jgi:hypothetical protein
MTPEEAIEILEEHYPEDNAYVPPYVNEAIRKGIEAMKREQKHKE